MKCFVGVVETMSGQRLLEEGEGEEILASCVYMDRYSLAKFVGWRYGFLGAFPGRYLFWGFLGWFLLGEYVYDSIE